MAGIKVITQGVPPWREELEALVSQAPIPMGVQVLFVDEASATQVDRKGDAKGSWVCIVQEEGQGFPQCLEKGVVDDLLLTPFREMEIQALLRRAHHWGELAALSQSVEGLVGKFKRDLELIQRIQKERQPTRFPQVKGFEVSSRYMAGIRPGGDFFDLAQNSEGVVVFVMATTTSYGLSNTVLSLLMSTAAKVGAKSTASEVVTALIDEATLVLGESDELHLFYGVFDPQDHTLRYVQLGEGQVIHGQGQLWRPLKTLGPALKEGGDLPSIVQFQTKLAPSDRLLLASTGMVRSLGGTERLNKILEHEPTAQGVMNELAFLVKGKGDGEPDEDCTVVIADVPSNVVTLGKP